jgi:hypothetical protein
MYMHLHKLVSIQATVPEGNENKPPVHQKCEGRVSLKTVWSSLFLSILVFGLLIGTTTANLSGNVIDVSDSDQTNTTVSGPLQFSTLTGIQGYDQVVDVGLDDAGDIYVLGAISDSDESNPQDGYLLKLNGTDFSIIYELTFGGSDWDNPLDMFVDPTGRVYVTGSTNSPDFPLQNAIIDELQSHTDCFIICFDVDPETMIVSTYFGGYGNDIGESIYVDTEGSIFVTGDTGSVNLPLVNSYSNHTSSSEVFVLKLNSTGTGILYCSLIGEDRYNGGKALTVDSQGNAYVAGITTSENFPLVNPVDSDAGPLGYDGNEGIVFCLNSTGNGLMFSTLFGGNERDIPYDIELDSHGNVWVCGWSESEDFPDKDGFQNYTDDSDCFIIELSSNGSVLLFSTLFGGDESDGCYALSFDERDNVYAAGGTSSLDFPRVRPATSLYQHNNRLRGPDVFVMKISPEKTILYSTPIGGASSDWGRALVLDENGAVIVGGYSPSDDFPLRRELSDGSYDIGRTGDGFVFKLLDISDEDGDNIPNWWEIANGYDPFDANTPILEFLVWNARLVVAISVLSIIAMTAIWSYRDRIRSWTRRKHVSPDVPTNE